MPSPFPLLRKIRKILSTDAGFVEIERLRGGPRMPWIAVPLLAGEPEINLDLKAALDRTNDAAGYELSIDSGSSSPRPAPDENAWAKPLLAAAGIVA